MKDQQQNELEEAPQMKVLSAREHEYVVNFRNRFLTFFALPLFLLFLALALLVSWLVHVPLRQEYSINLEIDNQNVANVSLSPATQQKLVEIAEVLEASKIIYLLANGTEQEIDCEVAVDGNVSISSTTQIVNSTPSVEATLVIVSSEQRFLFKLLDELGRNVGIKKPPENLP